MEGRKPLMTAFIDLPVQHPICHRTAESEVPPIFLSGGRPEGCSHASPASRLSCLRLGCTNRSLSGSPTVSILLHQIIPALDTADWPDPARFDYTFDNLASVMGDFADTIGLSNYVLYMPRITARRLVSAWHSLNRAA